MLNGSFYELLSFKVDHEFIHLSHHRNEKLYLTPTTDDNTYNGAASNCNYIPGGNDE